MANQKLSLESQPNHAFTSWRKFDRLLRGWLISTLSKETLVLVTGLDTSRSVWDLKAYAQDSEEREFTLPTNGIPKKR